MGAQGRATVIAGAVTAFTVLCSLGLVLWVATAEAPDSDESGASAPPSASVPVVGAHDAEPAAIRDYRAWQRRREAAWAAGDPARLRALYVDSRVARADVRLLRAWLARGVTGLELTHQLLAYEVLTEERDRIRVRVTQRLARAVAVSAGLDRTLPRDAAQTQEVVLRRVDEEWLVARVRAVPVG